MKTDEKTVEEYRTDLDVAVKSKEKEAILAALDAIYQDTLRGGICVNWITDPAVFQSVKDMLINDLGVAPRTMQLRNRVPNRIRRAVTFVLALKNGVNRTLT